jgi:hypothetical protein
MIETNVVTVADLIIDSEGLAIPGRLQLLFEVRDTIRRPIASQLNDD